MAITGDQARMARAAVKLTVRELSVRADIDKTTIIRIEGGAQSTARIMRKLQTALEAEGIEFTQPVEGVCGSGVRFKWGAEAPKTSDTQGDATSQGDDTGTLDARGWDWEEDASEAVEDDEPLPPLEWTDEDKADQIEHWRSRPEAWARLHEVSRQCLLRAMGVERL
jgi:transcriptional regulator with XRE-family HTH domain